MVWANNLPISMTCLTFKFGLLDGCRDGLMSQQPSQEVSNWVASVFYVTIYDSEWWCPNSLLWSCLFLFWRWCADFCAPWKLERKCMKLPKDTGTSGVCGEGIVENQSLLVSILDGCRSLRSRPWRQRRTRHESFFQRVLLAQVHLPQYVVVWLEYIRIY